MSLKQKIKKKNSQKLFNIYAIKFVCVCVYVSNEHIYSIHCRSLGKNGVEAIEYGGEILINQGHLQEKLDIANIAERTQFYYSKF